MKKFMYELKAKRNRAYFFMMLVILEGVPYETVFAAAGTDMWSKAQQILGDIYKNVLSISTVAAIVTASIALLMMNFSRNGKAVDESRAWLKRIVITWIILNGLGFIMAYVTPFFDGGQYTIPQ